MLGIVVLLFCGCIVSGGIVLLTTMEGVVCEGETEEDDDEEEGYISGGRDGRMGLGNNLSSSSSRTSDRIEDGGKLRTCVESQLGGASGFRFIVVPGRRSMGWDWRCSMKVTW